MKTPKDLYKRTLSTIFLLPIVIYLTYAGGFLFFLFLTLVAILASYEWSNIFGKVTIGLDSMFFTTTISLSLVVLYINKSDSVIFKILILILAGSSLVYYLSKLRLKYENAKLIPYYVNRPLGMMLGTIYLSFGFASLGFLYNVGYSSITLFWVFSSTVASDVGAYLAGSILGGKKILPKISPNKSWSGLLGAIVATTSVTYLFFSATNNLNSLTFIILLGVTIPIVGHIGDMIESAIKRYLKIKDTSNLIPGHGGILDRIDALILIAIYIAILTLVLKSSPINYAFFI